MSFISRFVRNFGRAAAAVLVAFIVVSPTQGGGGVVGTGFVAGGTLSDFGSVFVNGVEFFTQTANFVIDGISGRRESELRVGMQLRVDGLLASDGRTGNAATVEYAPDLRGTLDGPAVLDADGASFSVHGLAVRTDDVTVFESALGPVALASGDRVEVSGFRNAATGEILATFVSRSPLAGDTVVSGAISSVDATTFRLGALTVDYSAAALSNIPAGGLANGMVVRARAASGPAAGRLSATAVEGLSGGLRAPAGMEASAGGVVSGRSAAGFSLGGLVVRIDSKTKYRNGAAADLTDGDVVEVEGTVQADGSLQASRVTFRAPDTAGAEAAVASKDAAGFWLISASGVRVDVTTATRFRDRSKAGTGKYSLGSMAAGHTVLVSGVESAEGTILASEVSLVDPKGSATLRARARALADPSAVLLSIGAVAGATTVYQDANGAAIGEQAFFAKAAGRRVKATGPVTGPASIGALALEIEP
jgi:hypothetical protein